MTTEETLQKLRELLHTELTTIELFCCLETIKDLEEGREANPKMIESLLDKKT